MKLRTAAQVFRWVSTALSGLIVAIAASAQELRAPGCEYGAPHPSAPPELAQFGFLIGDFSVTLHAWQGDGWSPPRPGPPARWNGRYGLEGMAVVDEWYDPDPGVRADANRGINVRLSDATESI